MSATLRVETGISAGTSYGIDRPVLRVGSGSECELCLPAEQLPAHAVTLEYRAGVYLIYNRCSTALELGTSSVPPGATATWNAGDVMRLTDAIKVRLQIDGDPAPVPGSQALANCDTYDDPDSSWDAPDDVVSAAEPESTSGSQSIVQLGVIVVCLVACVLFVSLSGNEPEQAVEIPTFEEIVTAAQADGGGTTPKAVQRLQLAQAALVRGRPDLARQRFAGLRDALLAQRDELTSDNRQLELDTLSYVEFRLGQLP